MPAESLALRIHHVLGGEKALGCTVASETDLLGVVRSGLPYHAMRSLTETLGLSTSAVSESVSIPKPTLARRKRQDRFSVEESDRLLRLARITTLAIDVFGNSRSASVWLCRPNRALGSVTPLSQMDSDQGALEVERVLMRIQHGVFS